MKRGIKSTIYERTLMRYVVACRAELLDWTGRPMIEVAQGSPGDLGPYHRRLTRTR